MSQIIVNDARRHVEEAQASLELIGEGDFTPQDAHVGILIQDIRRLVGKLTETSELHRQEQRDSADRLRMALAREDEWKVKAGYQTGRADALEHRADLLLTALRNLVSTSSRKLNPTLATQAEWEAAEKSVNEFLK